MFNLVGFNIAHKNLGFANVHVFSSKISMVPEQAILYKCILNK